MSETMINMNVLLNAQLNIRLQIVSGQVSRAV